MVGKVGRYPSESQSAELEMEIPYRAGRDLHMDMGA